MAEQAQRAKSVVTTIFLSLILDLLAFTLPLPLFPRLIAWYLHTESHDPTTLLSRLLHFFHFWRTSLLSFSGEVPKEQGGGETRWLWSSGAGTGPGEGRKNWDVVLLGGAMGSLFSLCQCLISPWLGSLSDRFGRKKVLLVTMLGNIASAVVWIQSTSFASFLLARLIGGLSEGNVQLSTAIISDVTTASTRSKSLALIGIAFAICFTLGPSIGAYFASQPIPLTSPDEGRFNVYALPAAISLGLLLVETLYLAFKLPETKGWKKAADSSKEGTATPAEKAKESPQRRLKKLRGVGRLHGLFLLFFSGAEFTLTFLTYDLFSATNSQNGRLLSYIGILSALLQARHVRPSLSKPGRELRLSSYGVLSCIVSLILLSILPFGGIKTDPTISTAVLYAAATCLAYTSATVVTGLTAAAAACCDEDDQSTSTSGSGGSGGNKELRRGRALGGFRSRGQLGRAIGPLLATSIYWIQGPTACYTTLAVCLAGVSILLQPLVSEGRGKRKTA